MNAPVIAVLTFACLFGGALTGIGLRKALPQHHLSDESRHLLGMGLGTIGTIAGLVLGLLVGAATSSYNAQRTEILNVAAQVIVLDRLLAHYGPEAAPSRAALRRTVADAVQRIWPQDASKGAALGPSVRGEAVLDRIEDLAPANESQRTLKAAAVGLTIGLAQIRWLMVEQSESGISMPLLVVLIFWFAITFVGFGLFAPSNATVVVALGLCALAVSGAIYVMLAMYAPFEGLVQIPSEPMRDALARLGQR